ncbi:MAG: GNAT family N-acetyltransferase [Burkholderiales bacterium]
MAIEKDLSIKLATDDDLSAIAYMSRDLVEVGLPWRWTPEFVGKVLRDKSIVTIVCCDRGIVVAFASMYFSDEVARLIRVAVEPPYRGMGIARQMLEWLKVSCYTAGITRIDSKHRLKSRTARLFYRKCGFREHALHPRYYADSETAVGMSLTLKSLENQSIAPSA